MWAKGSLNKLDVITATNYHTALTGVTEQKHIFRTK